MSDFDRRTIDFDGDSYEVFIAGDGPAVLLLPEIPGVTPDVADFGRRLVAAGFSVWIPSLFGTPGKAMTNGYAMVTFAKACVNRTFLAFARGRRAPIVDWLRNLGEVAHRYSGGPGIGVIGMCFTGNFALALAIDDAVKVPVMSQPSLPMAVSAANKRDLHVSADDLRTVQERTREDDLCVVGLRFTADPLVPAERFERLRAELGEAFIGVEINSHDGNPWGYGPRTHSVLTTEYSDEPGHPTNDAWNLVVSHLTDRLL